MCFPSPSWSVFPRGIKSVPDPFSRVLMCSHRIVPTSEILSKPLLMVLMIAASRAWRIFAFAGVSLAALVFELSDLFSSWFFTSSVAG